MGFDFGKAKTHRSEEKCYTYRQIETEEEFVLQLDGISLYACASELQRSLQGGRIERIAQPSRQTVVLTIRAQGHNHRLLLICEPESPGRI